MAKVLVSVVIINNCQQSFDLAFTFFDRCLCKLRHSLLFRKQTRTQKYTPCIYTWSQQAEVARYARRLARVWYSFQRAPVAAAALIGAQEKASVGVALPGRVLGCVVVVVVVVGEESKAESKVLAHVTRYVTGYVIAGRFV